MISTLTSEVLMPASGIFRKSAEADPYSPSRLLPHMQTISVSFRTRPSLTRIGTECHNQNRERKMPRGENRIIHI